jgi:hypothetical protein
MHLHDIDTGSTQGVHARIVVAGCIDTINADGVDAELLEEWYIPSTSSAVSQRINIGGRFAKGIVRVSHDCSWMGMSTLRGWTRSFGALTLFLICNTLDVKPAPIFGVEVPSRS